MLCFCFLKLNVRRATAPNPLTVLLIKNLFFYPLLFKKKYIPYRVWNDSISDMLCFGCLKLNIGRATYISLGNGYDADLLQTQYYGNGFHSQILSYHE